MTKVWYGYGSEHSSNLVMIGRFKSAEKAAKVKETLDSLAKQQAEDGHASSALTGDQSDEFTDDMLNLLREASIHSIAPHELEQLNYAVNVAAKGTEVVVTTDEIEVSAFLKILIATGAKVEVYSLHDHPKPADENAAE
jgi:small ligand-binding sensory domain FIST